MTALLYAPAQHFFIQFLKLVFSYTGLSGHLAKPSFLPPVRIVRPERLRGWPKAILLAARRPSIEIFPATDKQLFISP